LFAQTIGVLGDNSECVASVIQAINAISLDDTFVEAMGPEESGDSCIFVLNMPHFHQR
jgi:hypothetical protein